MKSQRTNLLIFILTFGVFGILNTEMGVIGIMPLIADDFNVSITKAGLIVSLFALAVAISGPTLPLLFSGMNRKKVMLLVLGIFFLGNVVSAITTNFTILLIARVVPAFFHPIYVSLAFTVAAASVSKEDAPKAVSKVFIGVSAGMVLGVPVTSVIANATSLGMAMLFFAIVNAVVFIATLLFVPSMPVGEKTSYGTQLSVLKRSITWHSIAAVIFMNGAVFGVYSYLSKYLENITMMTWNTISLMLLIYGGANIVGNILAGKLLTKNAIKSVVIFPFALGAIYLILFFLGRFSVPMYLIILLWGILAGIGANINQYWITSTAPEAPEFANGIFLTSTNLGTTIGATVCGLFISRLGIQYVVFGGILFLVLSSVSIFLRNSMYNPTKHS
ncbi:arabinose ABC transporter permease [Paenibacillus sp. LC231]|uniref:MFS transporter n=1 Tax=Paenibacillus sp. LC231 TaxID=1120679 RepID=UPI0008DDABF6|nr:MFS transporter [Paenibacillus sp. LC231]OIB03845.1 arabinose ABC transporter permease [Paenibacillus sp. LC231]